MSIFILSSITVSIIINITAIISFQKIAREWKNLQAPINRYSTDRPAVPIPIKNPIIHHSQTNSCVFPNQGMNQCEMHRAWNRRWLIPTRLMLLVELLPVQGLLIPCPVTVSNSISDSMQKRTTLLHQRHNQSLDSIIRNNSLHNDDDDEITTNHHSPPNNDDTHHQYHHNTILLGKTVETFKLADLYQLELSLQSQVRGYRECKRLAMDAATGSCLVSLDAQLCKPNDSTTEQNPRPARVLERLDWVGEQLAFGIDVPSFLQSIRDSDGLETVVRHGWTVQYASMMTRPKEVVAMGRKDGDEDDEDGTNNGGGNGKNGNGSMSRNRRRGGDSIRSLLCCTAQAIRPLAALPRPILEKREGDIDDDGGGDELVLLEVLGRGLYLVRKWMLLDPLRDGNATVTTTSTTIQERWSKRPYQYSSAIHPNVASIIIACLYDLVWFSTKNKDDNLQTFSILDPTCGSGTFLAFALAEGFTSVQGYDCNEKCVRGARSNLSFVLDHNGKDSDDDDDDDDGDNSYGQRPWSKWIQTRDSSSSQQQQQQQQQHGTSDMDRHDPPQKVQSLYDCAVTNLPWGQNTVIRNHEENYNILKELRKSLVPGAPIAIVGRGRRFLMETLDNYNDDDDEKQETPNGWNLNWLEQLGYRTLGVASIPQENFVLPQSQKKRKKKDRDGGDEEILDAGSGAICIVTFAIFDGFSS